MKRLFAVTLLAITLMSISPLVYSQQKEKSTNSKTIETFKTLIRDAMQKRHFVGVGAAIILGDSVVWKEGFGYADKENKIPFTTQTALNIGSITKPFTAMGIMQLHEKQLLDINNPLIEYLPEFSIKTRGTDIKEVTVKSVIQHTSGIPNEIFLNVYGSNEKYTKTVDYLKNEYLGYPVNMVYHYSNVGYTLLGHTILKVSKQDYPDYIQDHILKPTGMNNSGFADYIKLKNVSKTYDSTGMYVPWLNYRHIPAGKLVSTIDDMVKFAQEMIAIYNGENGGFLKPETLRMFEVMNIDNIENINTCMGWDVFKNDSSLTIMHSGSNHVANAVITIDLKKKNAAVFFVNTLGGLDLTNEACGEFWKITGISSADYVHPASYKNHITDTISTDVLKSHTGLYLTNNTSNLVKMDKENLILNSVYGNFQLKPQTDFEFLAGKILESDSVKWLSKPRFIFSEKMGYKFLFWQDANNKRQLLGHLVTPQKISESWKNRLGIYKIEGYSLEGLEKFTQVELSITDINLLQLKIFYTSGEYIYYLSIWDENELIICGFDLTGGETIRFSKENKDDMMTLYGLTLRKTI